MVVRVYVGEALAQYGFSSEHPFGTDRLEAFWAESVKQGLHKRVQVATPRAAPEADIAQFHTHDYIARVKALSSTGEGYLDDGDTPAFKGMFAAASSVVGSVLDGLEHVMSGDSTRVFVPIAGLHHAHPDSASGFCIFNDPGIAIATLRKRFGIRRIAYVDIDGHHGDGVFYAFEDDPDLIFADIHEDGRFLFPGTGFAYETGKDRAVGTKLNLPMRPGADDHAFHKAWGEVEEFVRAQKPEIILLQAGVDSIAGDPLTHMAFTPAAHAHAAERLCRLADEFCNGRLIAMGGGGYNPRNIAIGWNAVLAAMLG